MPLNFTLTGVSGAVYTYQAYDPATTTWNDVAGNYAFGRLSSPSLGSQSVVILYLGETESCKTRLSSHEAWDDAVRLHRADVILARVNTNGAGHRKAEEKDLIATYNPPLNTQHRTGPQAQPQLPKGRPPLR
jgi:phage gp45-like